MARSLHILLIPFLFGTLPSQFLTAQTEKFAPPSEVIPGFSNGVYSVAAGDVYEQGKTDLVVGAGVCQTPSGQYSCSSIYLFTGDGTGNFTSKLLPAPPASGTSAYLVNLVDLNHDGHLDIVAIGSGNTPYGDKGANIDMLIYVGDGKGNFQVKQQTYLFGATSTAVAIGDFEHSGTPDFAILAMKSAEPSTLNIYHNHGDGTFSAMSSLSYGYGMNPSLVVGDFFGTGNLDLAFTGAQAYQQTPFALYVAAGDGKGGFTKDYTYAFDSDGFAIAAADLNNDGKTELVVSLDHRQAAGAQPRIAVLLSDSPGRLSWAASTPTGAMGMMAVANLNGDDHLDVIGTNSSNSSFSILNGKVGYTFSPEKMYPAAIEWGTQFWTAPLKPNGLYSIFFPDQNGGLFLLKNETPQP